MTMARFDRDRREFLLRTAVAGAYAATYSIPAYSAAATGLPGRFPGRVVAIENARFDQWLPEGVRWTYASNSYDAHPFQLDMDVRRFKQG